MDGDPIVSDFLIFVAVVVFGLWALKSQHAGSSLHHVESFVAAYGLPRWLSGKSACNAGHTGSISEPGRSLGGGNGNSLQYSCLGNPIHRGAWWATVPRVAKSWT